MILEGILLLLADKRIEFKINVFPGQKDILSYILIQLIEENIWIYIKGNEERIRYSIEKDGTKRKNISQEALLELIKQLE